MADPETTAGFSRIEGTLAEMRRDMKEARREASDSAKEIHSRLNDVIRTVGHVETEQATVSANLDAHMREDDGKFDRLEEAIREGRKDRMGLWKIVAGGGVGAAAVKVLTSLGLMGRTPHG